MNEARAPDLRSWLLPLLLVALLATGARLAALPKSSEANMDADAAHFMNVARCFARGEGFSNPSAWPAWINPERLPMPETFKEPGYPWLISRLGPNLGGSFRAGQLLSLLGGLLLPFATIALVRFAGAPRAESLLAGALVAASPLAIAQSTRVMVDSLFPCVLATAFAAALWRRRDDPGSRPAWLDAATGVLLGFGFLLRGQTLLALPAVAFALGGGRPLARTAQSLAIAAVLGIAVASPFLLRNLRLFGVPFHSDVGAYGIWPYVDHLAFSHGLDRPPAPIGFALGHLPQVIAHMARSAVRFATHTLPAEILGNPVWMAPLAAGAVLAIADRRRWRFLLVYLACTVAFIFAVNWDGRYFTSTIPLWCALAALGAMWLARAVAPLRLAGPLFGRHLLAAALVLTLGVQCVAGRRAVSDFGSAPELPAARALGPWLHDRLAPGESAMVVTTSFWAWFADRPMVHLVIAPEDRFVETLRRLRVRVAILPTSRLAEFAARYPGGRLPAVLVPLGERPDLDVTLFGVGDGAATPPRP